MTDLDSLLGDIDEQFRKRRRALRELLDDELNRSDRLFVHRTRMGGTESYVASVTLSWLGEHLQFAHNLPLFREKVDLETGTLKVDSETIDMLNQRPVDYSRQYPMAQYLIARPHHKFPPILAALNKAWVDDPGADEWISGTGGTRRAGQSAAEFEPITTDGELGVLKVDPGTTLYALDGQHRLLAILGVLEFIRDGRLEERRLNNTTTGTVLTKEIIQEWYPEVTDSYLQALKSETIGIEILPTVMQGENRDEALHRVRRIFVHVNRMAVPLDKGMMTALDEDNGFRIIGKRITKEHGMFNIAGDGGHTVNLVEIERPNLTAASEMLTTLETLSNAAREYLEHDPRFEDWVPKNSALVPRRPEEEEIEDGLGEVAAFFDHFSELPTMQRIRQGHSRKALREFNVEDGEKHLLVRPIAQQEIAAAVGYCHFNKNMELDVIFRKLRRMDESGRFSGIDSVTSYWWGLQVRPGTRPAIRKQFRSGTRDLMIYLLGGFHDEQNKIDDLRRRLMDERTTPPPEEKIYDFTGNPTTSDGFALPSVVTV